jgi:hypothetical protein
MCSFRSTKDALPYLSTNEPTPLISTKQRTLIQFHYAAVENDHLLWKLSENDCPRMLHFVAIGSVPATHRQHATNIKVTETYGRQLHVWPIM